MPIKKTNEFIVDIKGKDYMTVAGRIKEFWEKVGKNNGRIVTEIIKDDEKEVTVKAEAIIKGEKGQTLSYGSGYANEKKDEGYINKTSALENCETSAVGRALGMLGIGLIGAGGIASADEVRGAMIQQGEDDPMGKIIKKDCVTCGTTFTTDKDFAKQCIKCWKAGKKIKDAQEVPPNKDDQPF